MPEPEKSPPSVLSELIGGYRISQAIFVAVRLGIADLLKGEPRSTDELAASAGVNSQALYRLLVVLTDAGVLREAGPACFALTPMGGLLQKGGALHDSAIRADLYWRAYAELPYTIQTGQSGFQRALGMSIYDYLAANPEADASYAAAMTAATGTVAAALTKACDFTGMSTVVDVGGGQGALLGAILKEHPHLRGILFDRAQTVAGAPVAERCDVVAGDFFEGLPPGGDVYVLKWVISEWSDEQAVVILSNCRRAMTAGGRVLVIDPLDPFSNALFNLQMLVVWNGGRVRSATELEALFATAGLRMERIIPAPSLFSIVEGRL